METSERLEGIFPGDLINLGKQPSKTLSCSSQYGIRMFYLTEAGEAL